MGSLLDLMDDAADFGPFTPAFAPLFVSLPDLSEADLQQRGGYFGQVLTLFRARKASRVAFADLLAQTVSKLGELRGQARLRRLELLSYVEALVYHSRQETEHPSLRQRIDSALQDDETRLEVDMARRTMAEAEGERYTLAANKRTLLDLLRLRWAPLAPEVEQTVEDTQNPDQLTEWLRGVVTASDLDSIGIVKPG